MKPDPARKENILSFIKIYQSLRGFPPTIAEIAEAVGVSPSTVSYHLDSLEIEERIERRPGSPRAIKVLE